MTADDSRDDAPPADRMDAGDRLTATVSVPYKMLGQLSNASSGATGVLGYNAASSGTTRGVEGRVDSSNGYGLYTPDDAKVEGALDTTGDHTVTVDGNPAMTLGSEFDFRAGNIVIGHHENEVRDGAQGATIVGGGGESQNTGKFPNVVTDDWGTVVGGFDNMAGSDDSDAGSARAATVCGGSGNVASGPDSTVGGGQSNVCSGNTATVAGGLQNESSAKRSTVGGGTGNKATGDFSTVAGGQTGMASGPNATVAGGDDCEATGRASTVAGGANNSAQGDFSTVSGGGATVLSDYPGTTNYAYDDYCTVAGGGDNRVGTDDSDTTTAQFGTIGGGEANRVKGNHATVPGGKSNLARENYSLAAGRRAKARNAGAFVWADRTDADFASDQSGTGSSPTGQNTFHVRATGGLRLVTGLDGNDDPSAGVYLSSGGSSWQTVSARAAKSNVRPVDPEEVLSEVEDLEVSTWEYDSNEGVRRMGPMASEFYEAFGLGDDPETIGHVDADGVAFAAIQGLNQQLDEKDEQIEEQQDRIADLEAENERLRDRLDALEDRVARLASEGGQPTPADD